MKHKNAYQYSWNYNNKFQVLVDGTDYFSAMLNEIKSAKSRIIFETYLFESGNIANKFITELCSAKERNIEVVILLDEFGSKNLNIHDKKTLTSSGIELLLYNPTSFFRFGKSLRRDHRKLLIIDERTAFIGGAGITDSFSPEIDKHYWHDVMLQVNGDIVFDFIHSFNQVWMKQKTTSKILQNKEKHISSKGENKARVITSSGTEKNEIIRSIVNHIRASKKQVWLTSPYFISSWKIRRALRFAAKKGVDVRLVFPGQHSDHKWITYGIQRYYHRLLKANVAVYEFQPRFIHSKIILCDDWYTIGSSNFDRWNQFLNLDANIEVYDEKSHQQIVKLFISDFSNSSLIILNKWNARPFIQLFKEWISGLMINVLGFISKKFKR